MTIMYRKILLIILGAAIALLCCGVDLSAQEKEDKPWEISGYFGLGSTSTGSPLFIIFPFLLADKMPVFSYGMGVEYYITHRISLEGEINYLPNLGEAEDDLDEKYRLLGDINFLFYFDLTMIKRPAIRLFLTVGTGYMIDYEYKHRNILFQGPCFGAGLKVKIKDRFSFRILTKIHRPAGEETQTDRFAVGISYRF